MKLLLAAEEAAGVQLLRALLQAGHAPVAVMARERPEAAGASTWAAARHAGVETWPAEEVRDPALAERLRDLGVDIVLNVHSLYIVHPAVLEAAPLGWFNLHPGPLPEYAGLNAVSWTIYRGETRHAVTLHRMAPRVDEGAVAYVESFPIGEEDTALTLSTRCVRLGVEMAMRLVEQAAEDPAGIPVIEQDPARFHYYDAQPPRDRAVSWDRPAVEVSRIIRAFDYHPLHSPWGYVEADLAGRRVGVTGVVRTDQTADRPPGSIEALDSGSVRVACTDEWVEIRRVHVDGRTINAADLERAPRSVGGDDR